MDRVRARLSSVSKLICKEHNRGVNTLRAALAPAIFWLKLYWCRSGCDKMTRKDGLSGRDRPRARGGKQGAGAPGQRAPAPGDPVSCPPWPTTLQGPASRGSYMLPLSHQKQAGAKRASRKHPERGQPSVRHMLRGSPHRGGLGAGLSLTLDRTVCTPTGRRASHPRHVCPLTATSKVQKQRAEVNFDAEHAEPRLPSTWSAPEQPA